MSYLPTLGLFVAGLLILIVAMLGTLRAARRLAAERKRVNADVHAAAGLLRARKAALGVAVRERRSRLVASRPTTLDGGYHQAEFGQ